MRAFKNFSVVRIVNVRTMYIFQDVMSSNCPTAGSRVAHVWYIGVDKTVIIHRDMSLFFLTILDRDEPALTTLDITPPVTPLDTFCLRREPFSKIKQVLHLLRISRRLLPFEKPCLPAYESISRWNACQSFDERLKPNLNVCFVSWHYDSATEVNPQINYVLFN